MKCSNLTHFCYTAISLLYADMKAEIEVKSKYYRGNVSKLNKDERITELNGVQDMFKKAVENSENKVQIAMQMYEMVRQMFLWLLLYMNMSCKVTFSNSFVVFLMYIAMLILI